MQIVTATTARNNFADLLEQVITSKDIMLVAKRGKLTSALINIDLLEDLLALANSDYLKSIKEARGSYKAGDFLTHDELFGEV